MSNYDFTTLNPTDFEKLVCDLLNKDLEGNLYGMFRTSKEGKDKGIDILLSTPENDFEIVGQVKHYAKSTYAKLKSDLINKELPKVKKLNPGSYFFATSLGLSVENKKEIREIFKPYIKSLEDVFGKDEINDLLAIHKSVEERHFKLWFSSTIALQKLLNYKFVGRTAEFSEEQVKKKLRLFVATREIENAHSVLERNKFLIITGEPGVGKSTLSEILIYKYLSKDYALTYIYDDIKDVEQALNNDDSKQIFYFDDFLGHTQAEISKSKSAETSLLKIISRIEKAKNKYLILNTRKFILNTFLEESERFRNFNPQRAENKIEIGAYTYGAKRRMLDNHIFESELSEEQIQILKDFSFFICTHSNFSPRHIQFYTAKLHVGNLNALQLKEFIRDNLINPKKIWEHAYCNQISDYERLMLNTLYSLSGNSSIKTLEKAYNSRLDYEVKHGNFKKPLNSFKTSLQILNGGFIEINNYRNGAEVMFINPSLEDFLHYWIDENNLEMERVLCSALFLDQWYYFFPPYFGSRYKTTEVLTNFFASNYTTLLNKNFRDKELYRAAMLLFSLDEENNINLISGILKEIKHWDFISLDIEILDYSNRFLERAKSDKILNKTISNFKLEFFVNILLSVEHLDELLEITTLFEHHYGFSFSYTFQNREDDFRFNRKTEKLKKLCKRLLKNEVNLQYNYLTESRQPDEHLDIIFRMKELKKFIGEKLFPGFKCNCKILNLTDWKSIVERNQAEDIVFNRQSFDAEADYEKHVDKSYEEYEEYYDYQMEKRNQVAQPFFPQKFEDESWF